MHEKGRDVKELKEKEWVQDLAFMVDMNTKLQGRNKLMTDLHDYSCLRAEALCF